MNNYKIKVNNEAESREVQFLLNEMGFKKEHWEDIAEYFIYADSQHEYFSNDGIAFFTSYDNEQEITLPQLRDLVVLKRNNIEDATHIRCDGKKYLHAKSTDCYYQFSDDGEWLLSTWMSYQLLPQLKPISEQKMASHNIEQQELKANPKLFLDPTQGYVEIEWDGSFMKQDHWVEVPHSAVEARINGSGGINFINANDDYVNDATGGEWVGTHRGKHYIAGHPIVWQRTQDEPFFTPESVVNVMESIASDGISLAPRNSAESIRIQSKIKSELDLEPQGIDATLAERQSTYGDFVHVANTTGKLFAEIKNGKNAHMLPYAHEEALHMICSKIARIVNGDCNHKDSWHDIAGYAKLIENLIKD